MNNYCRNCGGKLEDETKFCQNCGAEVFNDRVNIELKEKELIEYKKKERQYIILVILLFALSYLTVYFSDYQYISYISPLVFLGAIITLIYARITMNKSRKIKILFNIFISLIVIRIVLFLLVFITCLGIIDRGCS